MTSSRSAAILLILFVALALRIPVAYAAVHCYTHDLLFFDICDRCIKQIADTPGLGDLVNPKGDVTVLPWDKRGFLGPCEESDCGCSTGESCRFGGLGKLFGA